jgi:O-acetyl-ADP-ribose deacetylase (regulator of RNase III)
MKFHLRDINKSLCDSWAEWFKGVEDVYVSCGDIFKGVPPHDAIVSPANSAGFMDGGIDFIYSEHFGWDLEKRLRKKLNEEYDGECPVGQAVIIPTNNEKIPWLISAPTMRVPAIISDTVNAYLAFRAVIREVKAHNEKSEHKIQTVLCPGLGTAIGRMPSDRCAKQMFFAYCTCYLKMPMKVFTLIDFHNSHSNLIK